jgi:hypothetical protein
VLLFVTVVVSMSFGILAAYGTVIGILHTFGRVSQPRPVQRPRLVLVPSQNTASGD